MNEQGKFQCKKHSIDYRIACDECRKKHKEFTKVVMEQIKRK